MEKGNGDVVKYIVAYPCCAELNKQKSLLYYRAWKWVIINGQLQLSSRSIIESDFFKIISVSSPSLYKGIFAISKILNIFKDLGDKSRDRGCPFFNQYTNNAGLAAVSTVCIFLSFLAEHSRVRGHQFQDECMLEAGMLWHHMMFNKSFVVMPSSYILFCRRRDAHKSQLLFLCCLENKSVILLQSAIKCKNLSLQQYAQQMLRCYIFVL